MICDRVSNLSCFFKDPLLGILQKGLDEIAKGAEDGVHELGSGVYYRIMSYSLKDPHDCKTESHRKYVDFQLSITGSEGISVFDAGTLDVVEEYSDEADVAFYRAPDVPVACISNDPGYFTLLFPWDAHRPQEVVRGASQSVRKAVFKIPFELFTSGN